MKNKKIVIAGASSGLGKALAELLTNENKLFLLSRNIETSNTSFEGIKINCDFKDSESIREAFEKITMFTDSIDVFINCVGIGLVKGLEDTSTEEIENVISTNLTGAILASQQAYKAMLLHKSGHIINVSSTSGIKARPDETIYCATKWGLRGFTESLRLAAAKNNIRVTGVYPGGMNTDFWKIKPDQTTTSYMDPKDVAEQIIQLIDSPTAISPSEIVIERGL